jgi:hypothetical protein
MIMNIPNRSMNCVVCGCDIEYKRGGRIRACEKHHHEYFLRRGREYHALLREYYSSGMKEKWPKYLSEHRK